LRRRHADGYGRSEVVAGPRGHAHCDKEKGSGKDVADAIRGKEELVQWCLKLQRLDSATYERAQPVRGIENLLEPGNGKHEWRIVTGVANSSKDKAPERGATQKTPSRLKSGSTSKNSLEEMVEQDDAEVVRRSDHATHAHQFVKHVLACSFVKQPNSQSTTHHSTE
jgi:hypothetical protein